jgi:RHS repeat-associated protein
VKSAIKPGQGSTRALTNSAGAVTDTYSYTAYGEIYDQTGTTANNYLYTGQQFHQSTGLYSLRARFYNPSWGRFLSQDTWAVNYSSPVELNRYGYAANRPITLSDPSGNYALVDYAVLLGVGTALGAAGGALNALACGGDVGSGAIFGAAMGLGFTALALIIGPQASLILGMGSSAVGLVHASADMQLHGANACNGMQLTLAIAGLWLGAQNFHSGPPSIGMTPDGGAVITSGQSLVVVGNTVTTLEQLLSILSLYMAIEEGGGGSGEGSGQRPGYSGPDEGWENKKPGDLTPGYNGKPLQDALASEDYLPSDNLLFMPEEFKGTAKFNYVIDANGVIRVARPKVLPHHPDLVNGENVFGAGEMFINQNGRIVLINDASGHYFPPGTTPGIGNKFFPYLKFILQQDGIPLPQKFELWRQP